GTEVARKRWRGLVGTGVPCAITREAVLLPIRCRLVKVEALSMDAPLPVDSPHDLENARLANQLRLLTRVHPLLEHNLRGLLNGISLNVSLPALPLPAAERGDATAQTQVKAALAGLRQEVDRSTARLAGLVQATAPQLTAVPELFDLRGLVGEVTETLS